MTPESTSSADYRFQVDLRGIIDLLSNHLYSGPQVYIRELLQNGTDAIRARLSEEPAHAGEMRLEIVQAADAPPTLIFRDNGIGLTEEEVHQFLATIGQSSKRGDFSIRDDFIGQFGIGLLSCFLVCDEIVVITKSARGEHPAIQWRGKSDGTYGIRALEHDSAAGTEVYLRAKQGREEFFELERVRDLAQHFGGLLPFKIEIAYERGAETLNQSAPWEHRMETAAEREEVLEYGRDLFEIDFLDCIPLRSTAGDVQGVAFVLPFAASLATKRHHRVYLKHMLLTDKGENLLPDWAFFVQCVVNTNSLRPTASRESFYEDDALEQAREELGSCLRQYLMNLARTNPQRLQHLIALHHLSIKALALEDEECFRLFVDWLPFETSLGEMTLGHFRQEHPTLRYVPTRDQFRQIAHVAAAQSLGVINAGYTYDTEILERLSSIFPENQVERLDVEDLSERFEELTLDERDEVFEFESLADRVLQPFKCTCEIKKFRPQELPTLYMTNDAANFLRSVEQSKEVADNLWSSVLDNVAAEATRAAHARLYLNYHNHLIQRMVHLKDRQALQRVVEMLYIQALLLGHYPLKGREMSLLNDGLLGLIEWGLDAKGGGGSST